MSKSQLSIYLLGLTLSAAACTPAAPLATSQNQVSEMSMFHLVASAPTVGNQASEVDGSIASGTTPLQAGYTQIGIWLKSTMLDCPERIWPEYNWRKMNVLLLEKGQPSRLWRGSTGGLEALPEDQIPEGARQGIYSFFKWQGEDAVSIYSDGTYPQLFDSPIQVFELIIHEGFHYLGQRGWSSRHGQRGTDYPVAYNPRLYRRLAYDRLSDFYTSGGTDTASLGKAAYWFQNWSSQFPVEATGTTDGYEGTARYVEFLGAAVAQLGCQATDAELKKALQASIDTDRGAMSGKVFQNDSEGYSLGGLAAFTLRLVSNNTEWFDKIKTGKTPLDILFDGVTPIPELAPEALTQDFKTTQDNLNQTLSVWIDDEIAHQKDKSFVRVVFSSSSGKGSYGFKGFYLPLALPGSTYTPLFSPYVFGDSTWSTVAEIDTVLISLTGPCQDASSFVTLSPAEYSLQGAQAVFSGTRVHGTMPGAEMKDTDGFTWFCGK